MDYTIGVDIGGTFTDCVVLDEQGFLAVGKALSTPTDFSIGALDAVRDAAQNLGLKSEDELIQAARFFFHACTIGDNTLITRAGAKTGLITTRGFGDAILMMRGMTAEGLTEEEAAHTSALAKPDPIVPRTLIEELTERVDYKGTVLIPLKGEEIEKAVERLVSQAVESAAVCLLWSIANGSHEKMIAEQLRKKYPNLYLSLSSDVAPFLGEYERTATTVFNAYIGPRISAYLNNLERVLREKHLKDEPLIMQAYGGVLNVSATCANAVGTIESGPAAGVVGSHYLGGLIGEENVLATDMGGTTFKVSVIHDGRIEKDYNPVIQRHRILSTKIWVESIGAGGGSIAWIDPDTRILKVGPQGAGASPGPVCYQLGGSEPTVSDADLVLGYLNENYFLGGKIRLDKEAAARVIAEKIAAPLGMGTIEAAGGIYRIANAHMSDLIRRATVERGHDPRKFVLFAFGGAGPVHAGRYTGDLGIKQVVIPLTASVHGATGLISSDVLYEYGRSDHLIAPFDLKRLNHNFSILIAQARRDLASRGFKEGDTEIVRSLDMRYRYQVHELTLSLPPGTAEMGEKDLEKVYDDFHELYEKSYGRGSGYREAGMEVMTFRLTARGRLKKPNIARHPLDGKDSARTVKSRRPVYFQEYRELVETAIYDFDKMKPGNELAGPAVIETPVTTIVVNPKDHAFMDEFRNIRIDVGT
jgi:N-methylhydantoinase A